MRILGTYALFAVIWSVQALAAPRLVTIGPEVSRSGAEVLLPRDTVVVIELEANASTGFVWQVDAIEDDTLRVLGSEYVNPAEVMPGSWGTERIYLVGAGEGPGDLELAYRKVHYPEVENTASFRFRALGEFTEEFEVPQPEEYVTPEYIPSNNKNLPSHYNFCEEFGCTRIKNQGSCGSCWAFGTLGPLEQLVLAYDGVEEDLSEQYLVSCNNDYWSCGGGSFAHDYLQYKKVSGQSEAGAAFEAEFPYTATNQSCGSDHPKGYKIEGWDWVSSNVDAIKDAIYTYGPVTVTVCAGNSMSYYNGGVFDGGCYSTNHMVVLTGWDDSGGYWFMRNSWGANWGENGNMRIKYGASAIAQSVAYVEYRGTEPRLSVTGLRNFQVISGEGNPASQIVSVENRSSETLSWSASVDQSWLTIQPSIGSTPTNMTFSVDASQMTPGTYNATVTYVASGAINSPMTIPVEVRVVEVPRHVAPHSPLVPTVDGALIEGEYGDALSVDLGSSNFKAWLKHDGRDLYVAVDAVVDGDEDSWDVLAIYFDADNDGYWPTLPGDEGRYYVLSNGDTSYYPIYNSGDGFEAGSKINSPAGLSGRFGTSSGHRVVEAKLDMQVSKLHLNPGDTFGLYLLYYDHVWLDDFEEKGQWPDIVEDRDSCMFFGKITVGDEVSSEGLIATPAWLSFQAPVNGAATSPQNLNLGASENGNLTYEVVVSDPWINLSSINGTTPGSVGVWIDPAGLAPGTVTGSITVSSLQAANGAVSVPVTVLIEDEENQVLPELDVDPKTVTFSAVQNGALPMPQAVSVINRGAGQLYWNAAIDDGDWFTLDAFTGTCPSSVQIIPQTTNRSLGAHHGAIIFTAPDQEAVRIELWLNITEEGQGDNLPPGAPVLLSPINMAEVKAHGLKVTVQNASDPEGQPLTYLVEVYLEGSETPVAQASAPEGNGTTTIQIGQQLQPEVSYWWKAVAIDSHNAQGPWSEQGHFIVGEAVILGGCACQVPGSARSGTAMLLGLLLVLVFRRRI